MFNALLPHVIFIAILLLVLAIFTIGKVRYLHIVSEGYVGLLCHKGKFVRVLAPGPHVHWGRHFTIRWVDVRRASILLPDQDVLTTGNVGLKLSLLVTHQVTDPVKATHDTQNWQSDLHNAAQLALRGVVGVVAVEALLNQRLEIGAQLLAGVEPEAAKIGTNFLAVEVKDVMFPADLKRAFADVLKAKQEDQAVPNFVPLKNGRTGSADRKPEDGAS